MIYSDDIHMISDHSLAELHSFAKQIGLKRHWFHSSTKHPHYDLMKSKIDTAYENGAKKVSSKEIVLILRNCDYLYEKKKL